MLRLAALLWRLFLILLLPLADSRSGAFVGRSCVRGHRHSPHTAHFKDPTVHFLLSLVVLAEKHPL